MGITLRSIREKAAIPIAISDAMDDAIVDLQKANPGITEDVLVAAARALMRFHGDESLAIDVEKEQEVETLARDIFLRRMAAFDDANVSYDALRGEGRDRYTQAVVREVKLARRAASIFVWSTFDE